MREQHLSSTLQNRVLKYFDYLWVRNKGVDRQSLFKDIPSCMQAEVSLATTEELIKSVSTILHVTVSNTCYGELFIILLSIVAPA